MDVTQLIQAISTVGFPICACGALFWYMVKESRANRDIIQKNTEVMQEMILLFRKEVE